ncbi:helix-turn-helix domain-containing protein [Aurantiacibacter suaedae]|uniref:helix-turn-helix domain-containing protein n=1 Tax=Aurantiacibacter suaedae TaxID=2545755 RepID=UPI0010F6ED3B|nr:helix-turn-helix domain-containing protein [Aurantiacibacter suaedae]
MTDAVPDCNVGYKEEVERLREAGVAGRNGRLRDLFDYLAARGPEAESPSQAEIAAAVFGEAQNDADDATVRVYVHRLRKKIDDYYARHERAADEMRLEIPSGIYALRPIRPVRTTDIAARPGASGVPRRLVVYAVLVLVALCAGAFGLGRSLDRPGGANALWQPVIRSERPVLFVLGDYYLFGEIDPLSPDEGRLIRDFRVNSPEDLLRLQEAEPERYAVAEDFGLNYLPFSSSYALSAIAPLFERNGKTANVIAASALRPDMLNRFDIVYVGLLSGLGSLEQQVFAGSGFRLGETYDELIDRSSRQIYATDEARRIAAPVFYRDYAYLARFIAPGGAKVIVVASERETGLRALGPIVANGELPQKVADVASGDAPFEALWQVTGQQGADLSDRLILARSRR